MEPIVFIHGYSAESGESTLAGIHDIYGTLPDALRLQFPGLVEEIDLSRYVSLDDGVTVDDLSRALERAIRTDYPNLLNGFNAIIHSTGALVIRNWVRRFSAQPSPLRRLIYLAGANFGSGWATIGKGQLAKWGRLVFDHGSSRGMQVLDALEFGSEWTIDMHLDLMRDGADMSHAFNVREALIIGSQADVQWFEAPLRYAKEDGSDGVVRVSACNVNFHYLRFVPTNEAFLLPWNTISEQTANHNNRTGDRAPFYYLAASSHPGTGQRPEIPLAIPYQCAHSGDDMGIVVGNQPRQQVVRLIGSCLQKPLAAWQELVAEFAAETQQTYDSVRQNQAPAWWAKWISEPRAQYDKHAQVIFRVRDQDARPVPHFDIFFDSQVNADDNSIPVKDLFEDRHVNDKTPHIILFYLRTDKFSSDANDWVPQIPRVNQCFLEVSATEPGTDLVTYLPMRFQFDDNMLEEWVTAHHTTIIDVELFRVPSPAVYTIVQMP